MATNLVIRLRQILVIQRGRLPDVSPVWTVLALEPKHQPGTGTHGGSGLYVEIRLGDGPLPDANLLRLSLEGVTGYPRSRTDFTCLSLPRR
jgi:hypothetical protein